MPIPACDAQYNFLLEERGRIHRELKTLQALTGDLSSATDPGAALRTFIEASTCLDETLRRRLLSLLRQVPESDGRGTQG